MKSDVWRTKVGVDDRDRREHSHLCASSRFTASEGRGPLSEESAEGREAWAIPWPCLHEFFSIVTHPRIYSPPSTPSEAIAQIEIWLESPSLVMLGESDRHWPELRGVIVAGHIVGPRIHDARIAAICLQHGVRELWTADRDFSRFPSVRASNPLIA